MPHGDLNGAAAGVAVPAGRSRAAAGRGRALASLLSSTTAAGGQPQQESEAGQEEDRLPCLTCLPFMV